MSKRLWVLAALAAVLVVAGSGAGYAAMPSLYGPTGIVSVPNALVAPVGQVQGALTYQRVQQINDPLLENVSIYDGPSVTTLFLDEEDSSLWALQALAGVASGAELWAAYSKDNSDFNVKTWGIGAKYQFNMDEKSSDQVKFAIGGGYKHATGDATGLAAFFENIGTYEGPVIVETDFDGKFDLTEKVTDLYAVATFDLTSMGASEWGAGSKLLGSAGILWKRVNADMEVSVPDAEARFVFDASETLTRPFVGLEYMGADKTGLGLEYRWKDNDLDEKAVWSAVLRHTFDKGVSLEIGTTNANQLGLGMDNQNWFARVGYSWEMGSY